MHSVENQALNAFSISGFGNIDIGYFVVIPLASFENLYKLFTVADYDLSQEIRSAVIKDLYPDSIPTFFKQDEIYKAVKNLENKIRAKYSIMISEAVYKGRDRDPNNEAYIKTERSWKKQTIVEAFEESLERNEWFSSIKFSINVNRMNRAYHEKVAECRVFKSGEIYFSGFSEYIEQYMTNILLESVDQRMQKFQCRGIQERDYKPSRPLEILFDFNRFHEVEEIQRFGSVLNDYPESSISVYHANPYYHANLADFADGSSFDIWILSSKRIIIKPQTKATPQAFERLMSFISSEYGEGQINEYSGK